MAYILTNPCPNPRGLTQEGRSRDKPNTIPPVNDPDPSLASLKERQAWTNDRTFPLISH